MPVSPVHRVGFPSRERLEVGIRVVGTRKRGTRVLARSGHVQCLIKHNTAAPYIRLSGTSERNRHRATIHRRRRNPYPYCLPAKASRPPCGFAVFPPPPSACFFSRHTSVCLSLLPTPRTSHTRLSIPVALLARAGAFSLRLPISLVPRPACAVSQVIFALQTR